MIDVLVPATQLERAVEFYAVQFGGAPEPAADGSYEFPLDPFVLRVAERSSRPDPTYTMGQTPRLELRPDDVDAATRRWIASGAQLRFRIGREGRDPGEQPATYAHVLDPFGHLWALGSRND